MDMEGLMVVNHLRIEVIDGSSKSTKANMFVSLDECYKYLMCDSDHIGDYNGVGSLSKFMLNSKNICWIGELLGLVYLFAKDSIS